MPVGTKYLGSGRVSADMYGRMYEQAPNVEGRCMVEEDGLRG